MKPKPKPKPMQNNPNNAQPKQQPSPPPPPPTLPPSQLANCDERPGDRHEVWEITPELAKYMLEGDRNLDNRRVRWPWVKTMADDMRGGRWQVHNQGILLGANDMICDGQHRLLAVIEANVTVRMLVMIQPWRTTRLDLRVDIGFRRTDDFILGVPKRQVEVAKAILHTLTSHTGFTLESTKEWVARVAPIYTHASKVLGDRPRSPIKSMGAACIHATILLVAWMCQRGEKLFGPELCRQPHAQADSVIADYHTSCSASNSEAAISTERRRAFRRRLIAASRVKGETPQCDLMMEAYWSYDPRQAPDARALIRNPDAVRSSLRQMISMWADTEPIHPTH